MQQAYNGLYVYIPITFVLINCVCSIPAIGERQPRHLVTIHEVEYPVLHEQNRTPIMVQLLGGEYSFHFHSVSGTYEHGTCTNVSLRTC